MAYYAYLYFIQSGDAGPIKIGWASNPENRLEASQTGSPYDLRILALVKSDRPGKDESVIHKTLRDHRMRGEWFESHPDVLRFVEGAKELERLLAQRTKYGNDRDSRHVISWFSQGHIADWEPETCWDRARAESAAALLERLDRREPPRFLENDATVLPFTRPQDATEALSRLCCVGKGQLGDGALDRERRDARRRAAVSGQGRIVVFTTRDLIRNVADEWRRQYKGGDPRFADVQRRLDSLDGETASAKDVAKIIGNDSWIRPRCDVCGTSMEPAWVRLGDEPDYDSTTLDICGPCLAAAAYALSVSRGGV